MVYKIKLVSLTNSMVLTIILLILFLGVIFIIIPQGLITIGLAYLLVLGMGVIAYLLWQILVTGKTEWIVEDNGIRIAWTKRFALANNNDINLSWKEIENISKGFGTNYYNFNIKLSTGKTLKFYHNRLTKKDDFSDLIKILYHTFNSKKSYGKQRIGATG